VRILLFTEIFDCGGIDTFIINLINSWPVQRDTFVIIANLNYPGLRIIEDRLSRPCKIIRHRQLIYSNLTGGGYWLKLIRKILSPLLRYVLIAYNIWSFRTLLLEAEADGMMVINGGYPGGDSCRAAAISWGLFSGNDKSIHNFHNIAHKAPWYLSVQEWIVDWLLCKYTSQFVTVSNAAAKSISHRPLIAKRNITSYIHNGLEVIPEGLVPAKNIRDELRISGSTPLCLMLGTYEPRKGHLFLFHSFKKVLGKVPEAHLLICGYGFPDEIELVTRYVSELGLDERVHLMEFRNDVPHLLSSTDVLVVASQAYESFGFTSVEAMAYKIPVVATDVGGIPEVVVNGEGGYCVDSTDIDSYAECIVNLLLDESLRKEQGEKGYKRYREHFSARTMANNYADLIHMLYKNRDVP
jgi:glycosyltransferase involved in cell wall biosynthesis